MTYDDFGNVKVGVLTTPKTSMLFADTGETCPRTNINDIRKKVQREYS